VCKAHFDRPSLEQTLCAYVCAHMCRVGQGHIYIYTVCIRYFWQGESPDIRSYTVYIYNYGRPYICVLCVMQDVCVKCVPYSARYAARRERLDVLILQLVVYLSACWIAVIIDYGAARFCTPTLMKKVCV
jgi:hypothetical protein